MASIYKTSQSRFYFARFSDGSGSGKRISKSTKTESKREAKRIAAEFESAARKLVAKEAVDSEIPAMIRRTVELAALESQQGRLTLQRAEELIRLMHQAANPSDTGSSFRRFAGEWLDIKEKDTAATTWRAYSDAVKAACAILGSKAKCHTATLPCGDGASAKADEKRDILNWGFIPLCLWFQMKA